MTKEQNHNRYHIITAFLSLSGLIAFGTIVFHILEEWTYAQSFYFSVATLTTVGYGDLHPTTDVARIVTAMYILVGVGVAFASITVLATDRINKTAGAIKGIADARKE